MISEDNFFELQTLTEKLLRFVPKKNRKKKNFLSTSLLQWAQRVDKTILPTGTIYWQVEFIDYIKCEPGLTLRNNL